MLAFAPMAVHRLLGSLVLCALAGVVGLVAQEEAAPAPGTNDAHILIDRVLAVVDEDPILQSEVEQVVRLKMVEALEEEDESSLRRRVLDQLIEQRIRFHEIDSFGFVELPPGDVEAGFIAISERFENEEDFAARLEELGLEPDSLRQLVARQLMVLTYVDERLGPRVFVDLDDIRNYYDQTLVPEMGKEGAEAPPLAEVREQIRAVLKQQRLNEEIVRWTEELRRLADVEDYFDTVEAELPAVAAEVESPPNPG